jgi:hypothetical protein
MQQPLCGSNLLTHRLGLVPTHPQLMGGGEKPREPDRYSPEVPRPVIIGDPGDGAASPQAALLGTPVPVPHTTKLLVSSPRWGLAPTTSTTTVLSTTSTDAATNHRTPEMTTARPPMLAIDDTTAGGLGDVTRCALDQWVTGTNEAQLLSP